MVAPSQSAYISAPRFSTRKQAEAPATAAPVRKPLAMRKYRISALRASGDVKISDQIGPAMPIFEAAFSAFARGTLIATSNGPVAVEDLEPGTEIMTADQSTQPLIWSGAMTLMPRRPDEEAGVGLTRIMADSYGMARPQTDLLAGPGARVLLQRQGRMNRFAEERPLTPAHKLADGMHAIAVHPPQPVTVYHLCLPNHAIICANGMEVESYHPGVGFERNMGPNMLSLFLSFFPHVKEARDFGALTHPRLPLDSFDGAADLA